jgi:hypothetical protein
VCCHPELNLKDTKQMDIKAETAATRAVTGPGRVVAFPEFKFVFQTVSVCAVMTWNPSELYTDQLHCFQRSSDQSWQVKDPVSPHTIIGV